MRKMFKFHKKGWILLEVEVDKLTGRSWKIVGFGEKRKHQVIFEDVHSANMYDKEGKFVEGLRPESVSKYVRVDASVPRRAKYITREQAMLEVM